ncbi:endo-beta-1,4-glucanase [Tothia fuscella]|uniref:cellulase n=1 Tax=Tothia fuscella TaxID=1048955 RepID=A0A9P4NYG8_9PEZI|nr:endo-beta-1,4-glucanase [Tothia fuscella]
MGIHSFLVAALAASVLAFPLEKKSTSVTEASKAFEWFGVNESGPEFGEKKFPGIKDKDYVWPKFDTIDKFIAKGMNTFRINFLAERLIANKQDGPMDPVYLKDLKDTVEYVTKKGAWAMIVPHNYGRYYEKVITDVAGFEAYWKTLAAVFKDNKKVIFDTNNEYHTMDQDLVVKLNQAAINAIRGVGAKEQWINVEGNNWSGAWSWVKGSQNGATMGSLTDPSNKIVYQMHQYLDKDYSGTHQDCVSETYGVEHLKDATDWLRKNKKVGLIGEFAGGDNPTCKKAVQNMLEYMVKNNDVWKGALWWAAGPWWADYGFSMEPGNGKAFAGYADMISKYA